MPRTPHDNIQSLTSVTCTPQRQNMRNWIRKRSKGNNKRHFILFTLYFFSLKEVKVSGKIGMAN